MAIFISLAIAGFIVLGGSFLFGHDTDHDAEPGLDHDSDGDSGDSSSVSFFSTKVIAALVMAFGATGAIAKFYNDDFVLSSIIGLGSGIAFALLMLLMLKLFYKQQASSIIPTNATVGLTATVVISISAHGLGEVGLTVRDEYRTYSARSMNNQSINKDRKVRVVDSNGPELVVEEIN